MGIIRLIIFVLAAGGSGYALHSTARNTWGREGEYRIARRGADQVGGAPTRRLEVYHLSGEPQTGFEVPTAVFDKVVVGDAMSVEIWRLPVTGELRQYTVKRGGEAAVEWTEGKTFYFSVLGVMAALAGGIILGIAIGIMNAMGLGRAARD